VRAHKEMVGSGGIQKAGWKEINKGRKERRSNVKKNRKDSND
jgi:hypothetical protein